MCRRRSANTAVENVLPACLGVEIPLAVFLHQWDRKRPFFFADDDGGAIGCWSGRCGGAPSVLADDADGLTRFRRLHRDGVLGLGLFGKFDGVGFGLHRIASRRAAELVGSVSVAIRRASAV